MYLWMKTTNHPNNNGDGWHLYILYKMLTCGYNQKPLTMFIYTGVPLIRTNWDRVMIRLQEIRINQNLHLKGNIWLPLNGIFSSVLKCKYSIDGFSFRNKITHNFYPSN